MRRIAILGSTGSIGTQTLEVIDAGGWEYYAPLLTCGTNIALLSKQIDRFRPETVVVLNESDADTIRRKHPDVDVFWGETGLKEAIETIDCEVIVNALVGIAGLKPTLAAIAKGGVKIALANKETLVTGGRLVVEAAAKADVPIIPIDSEHSAILQALAGNGGNKIRRIILTASGGPFRGYTRAQLEAVGVKDALAHPKWEMGNKITIDSATMMNKAFEVIEAKWLYSLPYDKIDVLVHPQSIVHSFVEYEDKAMMAQLGSPDMKLPISYALTAPARRNADARKLSLNDMKELSFEEPSAEASRALDLAYGVLRDIAETSKDSGAIALNGANEVLVGMFLEGKIRFIDIVDTLERIMKTHIPMRTMDIEDIMGIDADARETAKKFVSEMRHA